MTFNYTITAADFLEYYLHMVSKSTAISRKRNIVKYSFSVIYTLFAIYFFYSKMVEMGIIFIVLANLWFYFYPKLNQKGLERYYAKYTQENFGHQMNRATKMIIYPNLIHVNDGRIDTKVPVSEIEKIIETQNHFFLREKSANTFLIPKNQVDKNLFSKTISGLGIVIEDETKWQWK